MTRTFTFLLLSILLGSALILPKLLDQDKGWIYVVEEIVLLIFIILGFFTFKKSVSKTVGKLEKQFPWVENPRKRLYNELLQIGKLSIITGCVLFSIAFVFFYFYGEPEYFALKQQRNIELRQQVSSGSPAFHPPPPHVNNSVSFSAFHFTEEIFASSLLLFFALFGLEESFLFNENRQKRALRRERLEKEKALSKAQALKNQLNPHFMFNTLNVLSGLIHEDVEKSDLFIKKLSEIYRYVSEQSEEIVASLEEETNFIKSYVFLQKIRFEDKLNVDFEIVEAKNEWLLPSLTLELLVGNAIKHNIIDKDRPLYIKVETKGDFLIVKNDFQPRTEEVQSSGIGIKNLQERIKLIGMKPAIFEVIDGQYTVKVPLINPEL